MIKKILQIGLFFLISIVGQLSLAALPETLHIATSATYAPFESINSRGKIEGFDVDIVNALCKQMKVSCTMTNQPWDALISSLQVGKFDALIGAMNITDTRKKEVNFTDPYYINTVSFVGETDKAADLYSVGLKHKIVGVQRGSTAQYLLQGQYPKVKLNTYVNQQDAFLDLMSGRIDIVLADTPVVMKWIKENDAQQQKYAVLVQPVSHIKYLGLGYGIALKKGNAELLAAFNKALAEIKANGDYEKIVRKYF